MAKLLLICGLLSVAFVPRTESRAATPPPPSTTVSPLALCAATNLNGTDYSTSIAPPKKTEFMTAAQLAILGNLAMGDIIESKILVKLPNGSVLALPLYHKAVVVDPEQLQIVHYRFKDENDTTPEERRKIADLEKHLSEGAGPKGMLHALLGSMIDQLKRDVKNVDSVDDLKRIKLDCKGPLKDGLFDLMYKYDPRSRKVYQDNMVVSIRGPVRISNELDQKCSPISAEYVARRAMSRIGEEKFDLKNNNCETLANWARYRVNYTEQGQRFGAVLNMAVAGFNELCDKAQGDLKDYLKKAADDLRPKRTEGGNIAQQLVVGLLAAPICLLSTCSVGSSSMSYKEAAVKALRDGENMLRTKLEREYGPSAERILKQIVQELKLDEIIQTDM